MISLSHCLLICTGSDFYDGNIPFLGFTGIDKQHIPMLYRLKGIGSADHMKCRDEIGGLRSALGIWPSGPRWCVKRRASSHREVGEKTLSKSRMWAIYSCRSDNGSTYICVCDNAVSNRCSCHSFDGSCELCWELAFSLEVYLYWNAK